MFNSGPCYLNVLQVIITYIFEHITIFTVNINVETIDLNKA